MTREISEALHQEQSLRKKAEAALQTCEARYRTLFESAHTGIVLADAQGYYVDANASACRMLGYSRDELTRLHASDIVAPNEAGHIDPALSEILRQSTHDREWRFKRKDGSIFPAEVIATLMPDGTVLGLMRDTSDRNLVSEYREHLAAIVESSRDSIIGIDLNNIVTSWNSGAAALYGYSADDMIGTSIMRIIPDDRYAEERSIQDALSRGQPVQHLETLRRTRDGRLIDVAITASPIRDTAGTIVGASRIGHDITALKNHEREIDRLSRLYDALSHVNQAIVRMSNRDELFRKVCRVLVELGGLSMACIGWHDPDTHLLVPVAVSGDVDGYAQTIKVYTDDRPEGRGPSSTVFRTGKPYISNDMLADPATLPWRAEIERRGFRASAAFPILENGETRGTLSVYSDKPNFFQDKEFALLEEAAADVSFALDNFALDAARRRTEQTLHSEKLFSDTMIESMPGIAYFYDVTGRFLRWNRNFETVSGYSAEEIARMHPLDFFLAEDKPLLERRIGEVFELGESIVEASFVAKNGNITPYFFTGRRVVFEGKPCLVGVGIDISERMHAEAEREKRFRAEAADRIKSAFLATMSHELRTPLNSIIGFTGIMLQGLAGPLNPEQNKQLDMVRTSARHLLALVNDVLDISKIEAGQLEIAREPFDLRRSIAKVLSLVTPQAETKGLKLDTRIAPELGEAVSDERRFEQILLNLFSNAIKFTDHGHISLTAELLGDFKPAGEAVGRAAVRLQVSDTGIGIKPEDLSSLFQPFRQIDSGLSRQHDGTGLGLVICRRLCDLMGGEIIAESEWGKGSTFSVTLPLRSCNGENPVRVVPRRL